MKKFLFVSCLLIVFMIAPMAMADTLTVNRVAGYFSGAGGEFTLSGNDLAGFQAYYASDTKDVGPWDPSIQSFCIERNEYVSMGGTYIFEATPAAVKGGIAGGSPDPVSIGTAYLYFQFSQGTLDTLAGYDYVAGPGREADALALQSAIWMLEDELPWDATNPFIIKVAALFADPKADNDKYPVLALNLYTRDKKFAQDMLVVVPEPATMLLLGSGLLGLAGFARRRFRK